MATAHFRTYSGAGVLIFDTNTSSFLLVHDYTNNYNCCGGRIKYSDDDPQYLEKTARDELYEETRTLISCDLDRLAACPFVELDFLNRIFRCYILKMKCENDLCEQFQRFNLDQIVNDGISFRETSAMTYFPLKQFQGKKSSVQIERTLIATGRDGKKYPLNERIEIQRQRMANTEQQVQELMADIDEIKRLVEQSTRSRVKQALELQQRRFETDLTNLKEKQEKAAAAATEKKPTATPAPAASRSYTKEITGYAWDQTDKIVKIYLEGLDGIGEIPAEQVQCSFEHAGFTLEVKNLKNINYVFKRTRLLQEIKPEQSTYKVGKNRVIISLAKAESKNWECLLRDEKKTPDKPLPKMDDSKNPGDSLMEMMKNMYETGDDEMKRTIAKAWTESREKMNTGGGGSDDLGMPGF